MKNNIGWKILSLFLALVLIAGAIAGVVFWQKGNIVFKPVEETEQEQPAEDEGLSEDDNKEPASAFHEEVINGEHIALAMSKTAVHSAEHGTVSKQITATVMPDDVPDKSVDWSIAWDNPLEGQTVTDYITVTPSADGSNTATVTAHKGFDGASAIITATTRVGGFKAYCYVVYDGAPETFTYTYNGEEHESLDLISVNAGQNTSVTFNLDNTLGQVGSLYGKYEVIEVSMRGRFNVKKEYNVNGTRRYTVVEMVNLEDGSYKTMDSSGEYTLTVDLDPADFVEFSLSGNTLSISPKKSESSYYYYGGTSIYPQRSGPVVEYDSPYVDPRAGGVADNPTWQCYVEETVSGKTILVEVDIISGITDVDMSEDIITF